MYHKPAKIPTPLKERLRGTRPFALWAAFRERELHRNYLARRERYESICKSKGISHREQTLKEEIRSRLAARGICTTKRSIGTVRTLVFLPDIGWHSALIPDFGALGTYYWYDFTKEGYTAEAMDQISKQSIGPRMQMNESFLRQAIEQHRVNPFDWAFVYAPAQFLMPEYVRRLTLELGIPVVNMCLDDKQSWEGPRVGSFRTGQVDIAAEYDLTMTSARVACNWYRAEGGLATYMPEGFDASNFNPVSVEKDIAVSFIGAAYGFRKRLVKLIADAGIEISCFGPGWGTRSVWGAEQVEVYNRSLINLGMGGVGYSEVLTNVKTRDFEIPGSGGGMYLTSYNSDLALHYDIGKEIACYRNSFELIELIRYYLSNVDDALEMGRSARKRCLAEHRWLHRYSRTCEILGIL